MGIFKALIVFLRLPNLLIIAALQALIRWQFSLPIFNFREYSFALTDFQYGLLILSTVLIAAAAYINNDLNDFKADKINKPEKQTIGKLISVKGANYLYRIMNIIAIAIGFYLAHVMGNIYLGLIHVVIISGLIFYNIYYKRQVLIGNLMVSVFSAMVIGIVLLYEPQLFFIENALDELAKQFVLFILFALMIFSFIVSMIREVVKDLEDMIGDQAAGYKTLPIVMGAKSAKAVVYFLAVLLLVLLGFSLFHIIEVGLYQLAIYIGLLLILPTFYLFYLLFKGGGKQSYTMLSILLKFIMVAGIASLLLMPDMPRLF